jgi:hypothetical protein
MSTENNHSLFTSVHRPYATTYANAAARTGATGFPRGIGGATVAFTSDDLYKLVLQTDDKTEWILTATAPTWVQVGGPGGAGGIGDVVGPGSSTDNAVARFDATTGKLIQNSSMTCADDLSGEVGYINIPQNSQSAAYTTVLADRGKHIFHPSTDANARTFTIDSNANVAYAIGTAITFINMTSQVVSIAITSDTMNLAGTGTTGTRSLAQYGVATAIKIGTTLWIISGTGLT